MSCDLSAQYDKIYKYCYFRTGDAVLAEDLTQETFLRFYTVGKYREQGKIMAYLYTIASNLCKDSYRRQNICPAEPLEENISEGISPDLDMSIAIRQAMASLNEDEREVIVLLIINGHSPSETAQILGISRFALYRREKRALKKLKIFLGGDIHGDIG